MTYEPLGPLSGWTYDANGNRLTESGTAASTYTIAPTSNRITGITGALARTYAYDAAGNTTGYSTVTATYNNAGRLQTLANGSSTETSLYNALGQRIRRAAEVPRLSVKIQPKRAPRVHGDQSRTGV